MQDQVTRLWDEAQDGPRRGDMVSCTQLQAYLSCPRRWSYAYLEGLRPRTERPYLTVGRLIHKGFEAAMRLRAGGCGDVLDMVEAGTCAIEAEGDTLGGVEFEGDRVRGGDDPVSEACEVFWEALPEFDPARWDVMRVGGVPALELHFWTPCPCTGGLHGYVDAVLRERATGQVWCVDYKFRSRLASEDDERFSLQRAVYARACLDLGIPVTGTLTWQRLRRCEAVPRLLKDGTMSRAKVMCTWPRYREELLAAGLDPADYAEMESKLAGVEMSREIREVRSDEMLERVWRQVVTPTSIEVAYGREYRNGQGAACVPALDPMRCRLCAYAELCQAELRGYDADFVRAEGFTRAGWAESRAEERQ